MKVTGASSVQEKKKKSRDLKSCCELSHGDIFRRLRCETSICEFLPRGEEAGEGPTYRTPANVLNRLQCVKLRLQILNISDRHAYIKYLQMMMEKELFSATQSGVATSFT